MKKIIAAVIVLMLMLGLGACGTENGTQFFPETVKYNIHRADGKFSFNMNVISSKINPKIEFISAEGVNTEYLTVTFTNDTFREIKMRKINGKHFILLGVQCIATSEYTKIDSMKLLVNGKETVINFPTPIENTAFDINSGKHFVYQGGMPIYIFPQSFVGKNETDYTFSVEADEDTTITAFKLSDFAELSGAKVYVNGKFKGNIENTLPLELKKGDVLEVRSRIKGLSNENYGMDNLYFNIVVECEANGEKVTEYYPLVAVFVGNTDDAKEFVNQFSN